MSLLHGIPVVLHVRTKTGVNAFNEPIYKDSTVTVNNVLVSPTESSAGGAGEVVDSLNLSGKQNYYTLAIPKGDQNDWTDTFVEFFGKKYRTIGSPTEGIEDMIPLEWNKKVRVVRYEHEDSQEEPQPQPETTGGGSE